MDYTEFGLRSNFLYTFDGASETIERACHKMTETKHIRPDDHRRGGGYSVN